DRVRHRTEDDAELRQLLAERRGHRDTVEDGVDGHARQQLLLLERDAELLERPEHLRIDLVEALQLGPLLRGRVVADGLEVDRLDFQVVPGRLRHLQPGPVGLQPELEHPFRLLLLGRETTDDVLVEAGREGFRLDLRLEAVLVLARRELLNGVRRGAHVRWSYTENEVPHPQVLRACGFWNTNPRLSRFVS